MQKRTEDKELVEIVGAET